MTSPQNGENPKEVQNIVDTDAGLEGYRISLKLTQNPAG